MNTNITIVEKLTKNEHKNNDNGIQVHIARNYGKSRRKQS